MSRAIELLEQATPLPWSVDDDYIADAWWLEDAIVGENYTIAYTSAHATNADSKVIVYAVNRLPDYEAAVEALERLLNYVDARLPGSGPLARDEAHRVLARLRDKVPA